MLPPTPVRSSTRVGDTGVKHPEGDGTGFQMRSGPLAMFVPTLPPLRITTYTQYAPLASRRCWHRCRSS